MKHHSSKKHLVWQNIWKNLLAVFVTILSFPYIQKNIHTLNENNVSNFLIVISILLVTVSFASFAFTYRDSSSQEKSVWILSHVATFFFMLLTALLLLTMSLGIGIIYPAMSPLFSILPVLLYVAIVLYDFWDLLRTD